MFNRDKDLKRIKKKKQNKLRFKTPAKKEEAVEELVELFDFDDSNESDDDNDAIEGSVSLDGLNGRKVTNTTSLIGSPIGSISCNNPNNYEELDYRLLKYFAQLPKKRSFCFEFVHGLFQISDVNIVDDYGQSLLHEIARDWHTDVAQFLYDNGINIDAADDYGRTPLIVAAASDNPLMVEWLIENGADMTHKAKEPEEHQAIHFAAAYDAPQALKKLIELGANPDERDGLQQTPLFLAARYGSTRTVKILLEEEVPVATYNKYGATPLEMIVDNMKSEIAIKALDQCLSICNQSNSDRYHLSSLSKRRWRLLSEIKRTPRGKKINGTVIETIAMKKDLVLIEHPAVKQYIHEMSKVYGDWYITLNLVFKIIFTIVWTIHSTIHNLSSVKVDDTVTGIRIATVFLLFLMTLAFTVKLYLEYKASRRRWSKLNSSAYCALDALKDYRHPCWEKELSFHNIEYEKMKSNSLDFWRDMWVWFEVVALVACYINLVLSVIWLALSRGIVLLYIEKAHIYYNVVFLVVIWLHLNRSLLSSNSIGPFVTILVYSTRAVVQFAFLFCEFFIPFVCVFWVMFGGKRTKRRSEAYEITGAYLGFQDVIYQLYLITIVGDYVGDDLWAINPIVAEVILSIYFILVSIICMNIYIALLTDVFTSMISVATATVLLNKTRAMLIIEWGHPNMRDKMEEHLIQNCSPLKIPKGTRATEQDGGSVLEVLAAVGNESRKLRAQLEETATKEKESLKDMKSIIEMFDEFQTQYPTTDFEMTKESVGKINLYLSSTWFEMKNRLSKKMNIQ